MSSALKYLLISLAYFASYLLLALLSQGLWTEHNVLPWYPQAGLGLSLVLVFGPRFAFNVVLASTLTALFWNPAKLGPAYSVGLGITTGLGYAAGAQFLTRVVRVDIRLQRSRDVWWCVLVAFVLPIFVGAAGLGWFVAAGEFGPEKYLTALTEWWLGDAIGILSLLPVMLTVILPKLGIGGRLAPDHTALSDLQPRAVWEIVAQLSAIALTLFLVFGAPATTSMHVAHLLFLPLIWIVSRHGLRGAAWGVALLSGGTNLSTFLFSAEPYSIFELQVLMLGMAVSALLMGMVVSERERGKQALAQSQRTSAAVLDAIPDLMFRMKRDGTYVDYHAPQGTTLLVAPEKFLNHTSLEALEPSLARITMESIDKALTTGGLAQGEYSVTSDRGQRHFETRVVPVGSDEVLCFVREITARKQLESELIHSQKMDAVGQLAAGVAHDFNNLLSTIFGYVGIARAQLAQGDPTLASLDGVESSARQAAGVVRSLLTFTRKGATEFRTVDLGESVRRVAKLIRPTLPSSISLTVTTPEIDGRPVPVPVRGDESQLQQVVLNLAINARDAMLSGGVVSFQIQTEPSNGSHAATATLLVTDTGSGMDATVASRIFEPFFSTKPKEEASGLGLAITQGIVTAHGGTISVRSQPGKGTTFCVRIPLDPTSATLEPISARPPIEPSWVLVVDVHRQVREFLASSLSFAGFAVEQADGVDSVRRAMQHHTQLTAAVVNADMDGTLTVDCVRELHRLSPVVPIIVLASHPEAALHDEGEEFRSHVRVLGKPFQIADLVTMVRSLAAVPSEDQVSSASNQHQEPAS